MAGGVFDGVMLISPCLGASHWCVSGRQFPQKVVLLEAVFIVVIHDLVVTCAAEVVGKGGLN